MRSLAAIMRQADAPPSARIQAIAILLDRGWGRAPVQITGEDGGDVRVIIRQIIETVGENETKLIERDPDEG